ncbi:MAG: SGNH/GDSL hydrolase family protein [Planctomycetota bacterium]
MPPFPVRSDQTFLFIGDSITDCGRTGDAGPYGNGYVRFFMDIVAKNHPELDVRWVNKGAGGHTVQDLRARWKADVLDLKPHWLSVMIGINDCHRHISSHEDRAIDAYLSDYRDILEQVRPFAPRLVLLDPFYIATSDTLPAGDPVPAAILNRLPAYLEVVEDLARDFKAVHVRTQRMFEDQLCYRSPDYFCPEPVHPYASGHLMVAMEFYSVVLGAPAP